METESAPVEAMSPEEERTRLPSATWIFIVWMAMVVARGASEGVSSLLGGRVSIGVMKLVIAAALAWGIYLLFQRRAHARTYWLVVFSIFGTSAGVIAMFGSKAQSDLALVSALVVAAWALYITRSRRLRAALESDGRSPIV